MSNETLTAARDAKGGFVERVRASMQQGFSLGQTYWQEANSDSYSQNSKSVVTLERFRAALEAIQNDAAQQAALMERMEGALRLYVNDSNNTHTETERKAISRAALAAYEGAKT